jgi:PAS domain S-box-containing protein
VVKNLATIQELAEQNKMYVALNESEHRYRQIIQGLPAAIYTTDAEGRIMQYNTASVILWGREPEIGKDLWCGSWKIFKPDGITPMPLDACPMAVALKEGRPVYNEEIVIERPDGMRRNVLPHPRPIFDAQGIVAGAVNMLVDITDHRLTQQAVHESEERFRTLADQAPIMIWMTDEKGNSIYLNSKWCEFTGLLKDHCDGILWASFIHPDDKEKTFTEWQMAVKDHKTYSRNFRYRNASGEYRIIHATFSPRINEQGTFMGYIGILNDITLQESAKNQLEAIVEDRTKDLIKANLELERSNHELEQFAYVASHDLQEPLRKIQAFSNLLQRDSKETLDDNCLMYLDKITGSASRLSALIDDLLNFSRLTKPGALFVETDLNSILLRIKNDFELHISRKKAVINSDQLPVIEAVPLQMNQLFYNLISNSLKFSEKGRPPVIDISCRKLPADKITPHSEAYRHIPHYEIIFTDNGIGFEQEYAEQIFMIFQRLHEQYTYSGSGIGLALCRKIVNNHHGSICAKGQKEKGASFCIILPERQVPVKS